MWILIRWLRQKPADLDLEQLFKKEDKSKFSRTRVNKTVYTILRLNAILRRRSTLFVKEHVKGFCSEPCINCALLS